MSEMLGYSKSTFARNLEKLKKCGTNLGQRAISGGTVITMPNWDHKKCVGQTWDGNDTIDHPRVSTSKRLIVEQDYHDLASKYYVSVDDVKALHKKILNWEQYRFGKEHYKDMRAALRNWITSSIERGSVKKIDIIKLSLEDYGNNR